MSFGRKWPDNHSLYGYRLHSVGSCALYGYRCHTERAENRESQKTKRSKDKRIKIKRIVAISDDFYLYFSLLPSESYNHAIRLTFKHFLVEPGEYASKKQILEAGERIKNEEMKHSHIIVYWLWKDKEDQETKEKGTFAKPFYYRVWEINTQCTGLKSKRKDETFEHDPIQKAEEIFKGYIHSPEYTLKSGKASII